VLLCAAAARAHAPDTSYLRAVVSKHSLELRFTFDIATLHRIKRLDRDQDGRVTRAEAEAVAPDIAKFLDAAVTLELNGQKAKLGALQPIGWPVDAGDVVEEKNYGQSLVNFTFKQESAGKVIEDFYVLYEVFAQLGAVHRVVANIEQEEKHMEVVFNQFEPDYLYDTYWRPDDEPAARPAFLGGELGFAPMFREGVNLIWQFLGVPLMLLAACSMMPRKMPALVVLMTLVWFVRELLSRIEGSARVMGSNYPLSPAMWGMLCAILICLLIVLPASLTLRRLRDRRWFLVGAWAVLIYGWLEVTAVMFQCRMGSG
jgi:hypothetical protein